MFVSFGKCVISIKALFCFLQRTIPTVEFSASVLTNRVEVVDVHLHLSEILMSELADLEVNKHIAAKKPVVENQVNKEVPFAQGERFDEPQRGTPHQVREGRSTWVTISPGLKEPGSGRRRKAWKLEGP